MSTIFFITYLTLWVLFLLVAFVQISILRNMGILYEAIKQNNSIGKSETNLVVGEELPDLVLPTLSGESTAISTIKGLKTAISVISPNCPPCHYLLGEIASGKVAADPLDDSVKNRMLLGIGKPEEVHAVLERISIPRSIPVLLDESGQVATRWGITSTPTTVVVDDQMRVVRHIFGSSG